MLRRLLVGAAMAGLLLTVTAPIVGASPRPEAVTIESPMTVSMPAAPNTGTFTTSGSDLICASGTVVDTRYVWDLPDHLLVDKTFDCGNGLVYLRLQVHYSSVGDESFTWTILRGTDTYASLHGHGRGTTDLIEGGAVNHYVGFLVS